MGEEEDKETERSSLWHTAGVWLATGVVLLLCVQLAGWARAPSLPDQAPDFTLRDVDGEVVSLDDFRGQTVVLNFWATWCGPCRVEAPSFSRFARNNPEIPVLGIAADGPAAKLKVVAGDIGIDYRVLQGDRATLAAYGVSVFPTTVVVGPEGQVKTAHAGMMIGPQLSWATW